MTDTPRSLYDQFLTEVSLSCRRNCRTGNISKNGTTLVNYSYLVDGTKLSALKDSGEGLVYRGPFVYRKSAGPGNSSLTLESAAFGGGRLTPSGAMLYVTDYLGNVRAVVDGTSGAVYKASDYSAFGDENAVIVPQHGIIPSAPLATATLPDGTTIRDSYTGKEDQSLDFGTGYIDFGARQYNPSLRRWMTPDPLSEKYYGISPYAFCNNNPVRYVDVDGKRWVNSQGQIVCDAKGPTTYATKEQTELIGAMLSIMTGQEQLKKIVEAPFDVQVYVDHIKEPKNLYGETTNTYRIYHASNKYEVANSMITIYKKEAEKRAISEGISVDQAMAVNFGHEIEHTTKENIELSLSGANKDDVEVIPNQISRQMISEFLIISLSSEGLLSKQNSF